MARKEIFGTDFAKDAFKAKINDNFVELYQHATDIQNRGYINSKNIADFNDATENGKYTGYNVLNAPTSNSTVNVETIKEASGVIGQTGTITFGSGAGNTYTRIKQNNGVWTAWQKIITDKQPDWITATLQNGWTGSLKYRISNTGQIEIQGIITPGTRTFATILATLVIPNLTSNAPLAAYSDTGNVVNGIVLLGDVHEIRVYTPYAGTSTTENLHIRSVIPV